MGSVFWVGGGVSTNWNSISATQTNWSLTSGGTNLTSTLPTTGDDAIFDGNSGTGASVWNVAVSLRSLDCNGSKNLVTQNGGITITITGDDASAPGGTTLRLPNGAGATFTATSNSSLFSFTGSTNALTSTVICSGKTIGALTINLTDAGNTAKILIGDSFSMLALGVLTLTDGALDFNNQNSTLGSLSSSNSNVRAITLGSGTMTLTIPTGNPWVFTTVTNLTFTSTGSTVNFAATGTGIRSFFWGGLTFATMNITNPSLNAQIIQFNGGFTSTSTTFTNVQNITAVNGITITIGTFAWTGPTLSAPGSLQTNGIASTISVGNAVSAPNLFVGQWTRTGAGTFTVNPGFDGGLSGATFSITAPTNGGGGGLAASPLGGFVG